MDPWPHQDKAVCMVDEAVEAGQRRIALTIPTGGGKTFVMATLVKNCLDRGGRAILYTERRMLLDQLSRHFQELGVEHGIRAGGHGSHGYMPFQIAMMQTEHSRTVKRRRTETFKADLVLVDEAHKQTGASAEAVLTPHYSDGAVIVGPTATPLDLGHMYDTLLVAATQSDCFACGALIRAEHFAPNEPDIKRLKKKPDEVVTENDAKKAMVPHQIIASVFEWFDRLNPDRRPTILFAPGVEESLWFAQEFEKKGIKAAHIDGDDVWVDGEFFRTSPDVRKQLLDDSKSGRVKVICNRFVMREGIDAPWLSHGIFATIFSNIQAYLQSGGRLLRAFPGCDRKTIQDHGGNYWRHGSLNADREWRLELTAAIAQAQRSDRLRQMVCQRCQAPLVKRNPWCPVCQFYNEREPAACPKCKRVITGWRCPCGWESTNFKRPRTVVQLDGTLKDVEYDVYREKRYCTTNVGPSRWKRMLFRSRTEKGRRTFRAAFALFAAENNWAWPDPRWPLMPKDPADYYKLVEDVPWERLNPDPNTEAYQS